jgi:hypothetical protein
MAVRNLRLCGNLIFTRDRNAGVRAMDSKETKREGSGSPTWIISGSQPELDHSLLTKLFCSQSFPLSRRILCQKHHAPGCSLRIGYKPRHSQACGTDLQTEENTAERFLLTWHGPPLETIEDWRTRIPQRTSGDCHATVLIRGSLHATKKNVLGYCNNCTRQLQVLLEYTDGETI